MKENKIQSLIEKGWQLRNIKNFEIRSKEDDTSNEMIIEGIACVFDSETILFEMDGVEYKEKVDKNAFKDAKVRNTENNINAVKGSLDLTKITTDKDGKTLIGIKEQLEELKKSDPHFFETSANGNEPNEPGANGGKGDDGSDVSIASNIAKEANKSDSQETKSQFFFFYLGGKKLCM